MAGLKISHSTLTKALVGVGGGGAGEVGMGKEKKNTYLKDS